MILSTGVISALLKSTEKAIPELGDSELTVPPTLLLTHEPLLPLDAQVTSTDTQRGSFILEDYRTFAANAAGGVANLATLAPGLWDFQITSWGYTNNLPPLKADYYVIYQGSTIRLFGVVFNNNSFFQQASFQMLIRDNMIINKIWSAFGAADAGQVNTCLIATRHL